jgi:hypothetical protein
MPVDAPPPPAKLSTISSSARSMRGPAPTLLPVPRWNRRDFSALLQRRFDVVELIAQALQLLLHRGALGRAKLLPSLRSGARTCFSSATSAPVPTGTSMTSERRSPTSRACAASGARSFSWAT